MHIPLITSQKTKSGFEACCAIRVASLLNSDLLMEYHYGAAEERSSTSFSKLNPRHLQNAREMLLSTLASMTDTTFEIRISVIPVLHHKAQAEIGMFFLIRCPGKSASIARENVAERFLATFPIMVACLPEADLKLIRTKEEMKECCNPFAIKHAAAVIRRTQIIPLVSVVTPGNVGFLGSDINRSERKELFLQHLAPWIPSFEDWGRLLEILSGQLEPAMLVIRIHSRVDLGKERERLHQIVEICESALAGIETNEFALRKTVSMFEDQSVARIEFLNHPCFDVAALIVSGRKVSAALATSFGAAISGWRMGGEEPAWMQGGHEIRQLDNAKFMEAGYFPEDAPFSLGEAACAFRLPSPPNRDIPGLPVQRFRTSLAMLPPPPEGKRGAIRLFVNEYQGMTQSVHIDPEDRMRHAFIMGQTGTGKSTLLERMIIQDIWAGRGVAVIDPHGDMTDNILERLPRERAEDIIVFDFLDRGRPLGFNILQWRDWVERDLIIDELYRTIDRIYDLKETGGPMFEQHFRNFLKLLMGESKRPGFTPTILDFIRCYTDSSFRRWLLSSTTDREVIDFVTCAEEAGGEAVLRNMAPYVTSKFGRFVNDTTLKRIVGREESSINFDEVMNKGKVLLVKLGKGRFGSEVSALLANMLVARFKYAAMQRGDMPKSERRDFFLYCDEAHNLPSDNFSELLAEARKYRLGLVMATQYCAQLGSVDGGRGDDLLAAIFGNVGSLITFRSGTQDAEHLARGFKPHFSQLDIISLPNYHGYARMSLNNRSIPPFSFRTELDTATVDRQLANYIMELSRLKYGRDAKIIDAEINRRATSWNQQCLFPED